jgi:hypothetical protein
MSMPADPTIDTQAEHTTPELQLTKQQLIRTRYVYTVGARIRVSVAGRRRIMPFDHSARDAHLAAVLRVMAELNIAGEPAMVRSSDSGNARAYTTHPQR